MEFTKSSETTKFSIEYYEKFTQECLTLNEKLLIGCIQSSAIYDDGRRDDVVEAIENCFKCVPKTPYDIIAWRAGKMKEQNRRYVSASLLKETAERYKTEKTSVHKIVIRQGSKIFPLRALGKDYGDNEAEIIIDTKQLKRRLGYYEYK